MSDAECLRTRSMVPKLLRISLSASRLSERRSISDGRPIPLRPGQPPSSGQAINIAGSLVLDHFSAIYILYLVVLIIFFAMVKDMFGRRILLVVTRFSGFYLS